MSPSLASRWSRIALKLLVAIPLIAVSVLGLRIVEAQRGLFYLQQTDIAQLQTQQLSKSIEHEIAALGELTRKRVITVAYPYLENLRNLTLSGNGVRLIVVFDADYQRIFPAEDLLANTFSERNLIQDYAPTFSRVIKHLPAKKNQLQWLNTVRNAPAACWYDGNRYYCVMFAMETLLQRVQNTLEQDTTLSPGSQMLAFRLVDQQGQPLWRHGEQGQTALLSQPLPEPLQSWRLEVTSLGISNPFSSQLLIVLAIILPLAVTLAGIAWQLHRSHRQDLEAKQRRIDFSRQLSHDFRTPLANLMLYTDLIQQEAEDNAHIGEYCAVMASESRRLETLVENALALTDNNTNRTPALQLANPDRIIERIAERYRPMLQQAHSSLAIEAGARESCCFDVMAWERILINLLDNACKYAPGSRIDITTHQQADTLRMTVRDYGPARQDRPKRQETKSFSIGLEACRQLARSNGGDIDIRDAAPGLAVAIWIKSSAAQDIPPQPRS